MRNPYKVFQIGFLEGAQISDELFDKAMQKAIDLIQQYELEEGHIGSFLTAYVEAITGRMTDIVSNINYDISMLSLCEEPGEDEEQTVSSEEENARE